MVERKGSKKPDAKSNVKMSDIKAEKRGMAVDKMRGNKDKAISGKTKENSLFQRHHHTEKMEKVLPRVKHKVVAKEIANKTPLKMAVHGEHKQAHNQQMVFKKNAALKIGGKFIESLKNMKDEVNNDKITEAIKELGKLTKKFQQSGLGEMDYKAYKKECKNIVNNIGLSRSETRKAHTFVEHLHEALRLMFKTFDYLITSMTTLGKKSSMGRTLGAHSLVGRDHFFNPLTQDSKFGTLVKKFEEALDNLDSSKTHQIKI